MACSCGKKRGSESSASPIPTGFGQPAPADQLMPPTGKQQSFQLQRLDGSTQTFGSKLDAQAEMVRKGGTIKPL